MQSSYLSYDNTKILEIRVYLIESIGIDIVTVMLCNCTWYVGIRHDTGYLKLSVKNFINEYYCNLSGKEFVCKMVKNISVLAC